MALQVFSQAVDVKVRHLNEWINNEWIRRPARTQRMTSFFAEMSAIHVRLNPAVMTPLRIISTFIDLYHQDEAISRRPTLPSKQLADDLFRRHSPGDLTLYASIMYELRYEMQLYVQNRK